MLDRKLTENGLKGYIVALVDVKPPQIIQAFSRTLNESKFLPPPATLRELSGLTTTGDAVASEAKAELFRIVAAIPASTENDCARNVLKLVNRFAMSTGMAGTVSSLRQT
jgi:ABC-type taurine transport system substrate-binding protein